MMSLLTLIYFVERMNGVTAFGTFGFAFSSIHSMVRSTMIMFSVVLLVKLIVEECKNKTMSLMFMYPIVRRKVLWYKAAMVVGFAFLTISLSNLFIGSVLIMLNPLIGFVPDSLDWNTAAKFAAFMLSDAFVAGGISLLPMVVGLRKYSVPATFVTAIIVVIALLTELGSQVMVPPIMGATGLLGAFVSIRRIERADM